MATNEEFALTEKYKNNIWAAHIYRQFCTDIAAKKDSETADDTSNDEFRTTLNICDVQLDGFKPLTEDVRLAKCWVCEKFTQVQNLESHITDHSNVSDYLIKVNHLLKRNSAYAKQSNCNAANQHINSSKQASKSKKVKSSEIYSSPSNLQISTFDSFRKDKPQETVSQPVPFLSENSVISEVPVEGTNEKDSETVVNTSHEEFKTALNICDVQLDGFKPLTEDVRLAKCWVCKKFTQVQNLESHIADHANVTDYLVKVNHLSKNNSVYVEQSNCNPCVNSLKHARKHKKVKSSEFYSPPSSLQISTFDCLPKDKPEETTSQSVPFLSENSVISEVPVEGDEHDPSHISNSFTKPPKRKKGLTKASHPLQNRSKKVKSDQNIKNVSYVNVQWPKNVQTLHFSNNVLSEQSTCALQRTECDILRTSNSSLNSNCTKSEMHFSNPESHTHNDTESNYSMNSEHSAGMLSSPVLYSPNQLPINCLHQSTSSSAECSNWNNLEHNETIRTSNQTIKQISEESASNIEQNTETTVHFLSIVNKQPVKSPPRACPVTSSVLNNNPVDDKHESKNSKPFLGVKKESSNASICSSRKPSVEDSFSKNISVEDMHQNDIKSSIRTCVLHCARPNITINRLGHSPYGLVLLNDRSDRLRQAFMKAIAEKNRKMKPDLDKVGTECNSPNSVPLPPANSVQLSPQNSVPLSPLNSVLLSTESVTSDKSKLVENSAKEGDNIDNKTIINSQYVATGTQTFNSVTKGFNNSTLRTKPEYKYRYNNGCSIFHRAGHKNNSVKNNKRVFFKPLRLSGLDNANDLSRKISNNFQESIRHCSDSYTESNSKSVCDNLNNAHLAGSIVEPPKTIEFQVNESEDFPVLKICKQGVRKS